MRFSLPSVGASVRSKLRAAIGKCDGLTGLTDALPPIPLTLDRQSLRVRYRCAIAQRLAAIAQRSPVDLATDLATAWHQDAQVQGASLATIQVHRSGSLDLELTDRAIAIWLNALSQLQIPSLAPSADPQAFAVYYALDRCRSLITAAEHEGWFVRRDLDQSWLDDRGQLRLSLTAERQMIHHLVQTLDTIADHPPTSTQTPHPKLADRLAAAFETLHRHSRPWHARQTQDTATAIARLGLFLSCAHTVQATLWTPSQFVDAVDPWHWLHPPDARTNTPDQNHS